MVIFQRVFHQVEHNLINTVLLRHYKAVILRLAGDGDAVMLRKRRQHPRRALHHIGDVYRRKLLMELHVKPRQAQKPVRDARQAHDFLADVV